MEQFIYQSVDNWHVNFVKDTNISKGYINYLVTEEDDKDFFLDYMDSNYKQKPLSVDLIIVRNKYLEYLYSIALKKPKKFNIRIKTKPIRSITLDSKPQKKIQTSVLNNIQYLIKQTTQKEPHIDKKLQSYKVDPSKLFLQKDIQKNFKKLGTLAPEHAKTQQNNAKLNNLQENIKIAIQNKLRAKHDYESPQKENDVNDAIVRHMRSLSQNTNESHAKIVIQKSQYLSSSVQNIESKSYIDQIKLKLPQIHQQKQTKSISILDFSKKNQ